MCVWKKQNDEYQSKNVILIPISSLLIPYIICYIHYYMLILQLKNQRLDDVHCFVSAPMCLLSLVYRTYHADIAISNIQKRRRRQRWRWWRWQYFIHTFYNIKQKKIHTRQKTTERKTYNKSEQRECTLSAKATEVYGRLSASQATA